MVGPHKLAGERAELQRPLVALRREADGGYRVVGVVRHKFAFKKRPQILITKSKAPVQRAAKRVRAEAPGGGGGGGGGGGVGPGDAQAAPQTPVAVSEPAAAP